TFRLSPDEYLLTLRDKIISNLSFLMDKDELQPFVIDVIKEYIGRARYEGADMAEADLPFFERYFVKKKGRSASAISATSYLALPMKERIWLRLTFLFLNDILLKS